MMRQISIDRIVAKEWDYDNFLVIGNEQLLNNLSPIPTGEIRLN